MLRLADSAQAHAAAPPPAGRVAYASGNFGKSVVGSYLDIFALFYLTDILHVSAGLAGLMLLTSLVWDGLANPVVGVAADRLRRALSTAKAFFFIGAPLTALTFVAFFHSSHVPPEFRHVYLLATLLAFRTAYTIVDVPHNAMLALMTDSSFERTNIASLRIFFSSAGRIVVTLAAAYFLAQGAADSATRFANAALGFAAVYLVVLGVCMRAVSRIAIRTAGPPGSFARNLRAVFRAMEGNRQLLIVFGLTALTSATVPVLASAILYFAKYGLHNVELASTALMLMACAQALSLLFWSKLANRLAHKKHALQVANGVLAGVGLLFMSTLGTPPALLSLTALAGFAVGGIHMLNWSMLPDAMDAHRNTGSERYDMSIFGLYTLTNKTCHGISQGLTGLVLVWFGYRADAIPMDTIGAITGTLIALPTIGALACMWVLRYQTLRQSQHAAPAAASPRALVASTHGRAGGRRGAPGSRRLAGGSRHRPA